MVKINRDKCICFRVTEKEKNDILKKASKSNMSISDYCFHSAMKSEIVIIDTSDLRDVTKELNKIGNNLNQAVVLARTEKIKYINITPVTEKIKDVWELLKMLTEKTKR